MDLPGDDLARLPHGSSSEGTRFDASQYAFFGEDITEEVELGGLEEEEDENVVFAGDGEFRLSSMEGKLKGEDRGSLSGIDDLAAAFSTLNNVDRGQRNVGFISERDTLKTESSSGTDWLQDYESSDWLEQQIANVDSIQNQWPFQQPSSDFSKETKPLQRTSTYPQQNPQRNLSDPVFVSKSPFVSGPPPSGRPCTPPNDNYLLPFSPEPAHMHMPLSTPDISFQASQLPLSAHSRMDLVDSTNQFVSPVLPINPNQPNFPMNPNNLFPVDQSSLFPSIMPPNLSRPNGLPHPSHPMNKQTFSQQDKQRFLPVRPSHVPVPFLHPHVSSHYLSPAMTKIDPTHGMVDIRNERTAFIQRGREGVPFSQKHWDMGRQKNDHDWPQFKAKYMSSEEIENIMKMQHAATHSSNPYVDDYYHQACLAKRSGTRMKHNFCPASILDLPARSRPSDEPHPYLNVDALGRIAFSSIRRPRPLLEVDTISKFDDKGTDKKSVVKPLDEEPLLEARIVIEESLCLILDVDDIDRVLQFNQPMDGGSQLRQRRMVLLEGIASSLQLVDPFGQTKDGQSVSLAPKDDLVFLHISSLPKGRKLLCRFLKLLVPGSGLTRIICMAIFRHLRFLFGGPHLDPTVTEITSNLSKSVSFCAHGMDLNALSCCLAAIVCSSEKPAFRAIAGSSGDGASVIVKSVLDQATALLADPRAAQNLSVRTRTLWQESFNVFFKLLIEYCSAKYESVVQSFRGHALDSGATSDAARAISNEVPIELLRASLPHTDEQQRKLLLDFAQRSMPV